MYLHYGSVVSVVVFVIYLRYNKAASSSPKNFTILISVTVSKNKRQIVSLLSTLPFKIQLLILTGPSDVSTFTMSVQNRLTLIDVPQKSEHIIPFLYHMLQSPMDGPSMVHCQNSHACHATLTFPHPTHPSHIV